MTKRTEVNYEGKACVNVMVRVESGVCTVGERLLMVAEMEDDGTTTEDDTPREREMNAKTKA